MSKQPPPAPTVSAVGPSPTVIQISRTPQHWKFTQHHCTTRSALGSEQLRWLDWREMEEGAGDQGPWVFCRLFFYFFKGLLPDICVLSNFTKCNSECMLGDTRTVAAETNFRLGK